VEAGLRRVQKAFDLVNQRLRASRDPLSDRVLDNLVAGYAHVDTLVAAGVDLFAMGSLEHLLELNTRVLCGARDEDRDAYRRHIDATAERFYGEREGGVRDVVEWSRRLERRSVWTRAAGIYVRILSQPQLFIEGNHRTGALVMSYLLVRRGRPPFVLSVENAAAYFDPSTVIRDTHKHSAAMMFRAPLVRRRLAALLRAQEDWHYLRG
jgi:prophage maintenance system killer protein